MVRSKGTPKRQSEKKRPGHTVMYLGNKSFKVSKTILRSIRKLQMQITLCVPRLSFSRVVREILQTVSVSRDNFFIQSMALKALQEAAEGYMVDLLDDANKCAAHAKRITVRPDDIRLVLNIRDAKDPAKDWVNYNQATS